MEPGELYSKTERKADKYTLGPWLAYYDVQTRKQQFWILE